MKFSLFFVLATVTSSLSAKDWPKFLGPNGNATSTETGLLKSFPEDGPEILWKAKLEGGFGGAAVVGDEIFLGDRVEQEQEMLVCLDFKTGKEKWRYVSPSEGEPSYPGSRSVPTVEDDAVYFLGSFGEVFRINRETHKADWKIKLSDRYPDAKDETPKWGYAQCTLIVDDVLIALPFGTETGIAGWDKKTGEELWRSGPINDSHSSPTIMTFGGQKQVVILTAGEEGGIQSYHPKTGQKLWSTKLYENRIPITVPIQIDENRIFASGGYNAGSVMLSVHTPGDEYKISKLWETDKGTQVHPPIVIDDHLYFLANESSNHKTKTRRAKGGLACFTLDGKELWNTGDSPFMGRGGSIFADGILIIQDGENGILRLVEPSPKEFKLLGEANVFDTDPKSKKDLQYWSPITLSDGKLLLRGQDHLLCVEMKK